MADLARIARPWLLSLRPPVRAPAPAAVSPYLGLGYSRGISATTASRARILATKTARSTRNIDKTTTKRLREKDAQAQAQAMAAYLLPYTIVPPPIWRFPRSPSKFAKMVWLLAKNRAMALGSLLSVYFLSMRGKGIGWPQFRARKRASIPAAKALHAQMSEAAAAGDKDTLRRICSAGLFETLAGAIDSRPRHTRTEWELVRYDSPLRYPRIADFRVMYQPADTARGMRVLKQAVVSISSVQRLTRYDDADGGRKIPGGERERHMTEHLVLQAVVEDGTFETGPWKIWGTLPEMSFETIRDDDVIFTEAIAAQDQKKRRR